jgi:cyclase
LTKEISDAISLPVIAHGGIGSMNDVEDLLESGIIDSLAIGSALHYEALKNFNLDLNNRKEGNRFPS